jgi:hypothetical protein
MGEGLKKLKHRLGTTEKSRRPTGIVQILGVTTEGWLQGSAGTWPKCKKGVVLFVYFSGESVKIISRKLGIPYVRIWEG